MSARTHPRLVGAFVLGAVALGANQVTARGSIIGVFIGFLVLFMGGLLATVFLKKYASAPPYPLKDPRLIEAMGLYHPVATQISGGELDQTDDLPDAPPQPHGGAR